MKIEGDWVEFSTGRVSYANFGVIGLGDDLTVSHGADGGFWAPDYEGEDALTPEERVELADYMIERWTAFRAAARAPLPKAQKNI